jgi:ATP-dependent helicase HepA
MNPEPSSRYGHDPLGWREEFQRALALAPLALLRDDSDIADEPARRAAYQLAASLGHCRLFGVNLGEVDGTLSIGVATAATLQWSICLRDWLLQTDQLAHVWAEAAEEVEALDASADLLTARMESWAVFLAADEAYHEALEADASGRSRLSNTLRAALDALGRFDDVLQRNSVYLAPVACTELLENWRRILAPEYRTTPPWWLAGNLESLFDQVRENGPTWLPQTLQREKAVTSPSQPSSTVPVRDPGVTTFSPSFSLGQLVTLRSDPSVVGAVVEVVTGAGEPRYVVFCNGRKVPYYAIQLAPAPVESRDGELVSPETFNARLTALHLQQPGLSSLYSLHAARIDFIPYQFRPVLKFIRSDRPRLLIADSVGVGKTIEAGLILRELQARREVRTILILCPKNLVVDGKWQREMRRFDEEFVHLDGDDLRHCLRETDANGEWPERFARAIIPHSLFTEALLYGTKGRGRTAVPGLLQLDPPPHFDLIIVDEAHHIHNTDTLLHRGVRFLTDHAEGAVFLTASPIQLASDNLFVLLNTLRPDLVIDRKTYQDMSEPNPHINQAANLLRFGQNGWQKDAAKALQDAANTRWGRSILRQDPRYVELQQRLKGEKLESADRVRSLRTVEEFHSFHGLINRTRRRDIDEFTERKAYTKPIKFTGPQQALHDRLLEIQTRLLRRSHGSVPVQFMLTTLRRQAASCIHGLVPLLRDILTRRIDESEWFEMDELAESGPDVGAASSQEVEELIAEAERLDDADPKLECLLGVIREKQSADGNKVLIFSCFRHTLRYLETNLRREGVRVGLIHGGVKDADRVDIRDRFKLSKDVPDALDVLLMSEVGSEGLDYQFCDCMVNYDLPWNPMKIDQRIGRIDRNGQKSPTVAIYNLITPGTVDADIYDRCMMRLGVFKQALGDNEEILGQITTEIRTLAEDLTLTDEERRRHLQQLADNQIHLLEEQAVLEKRSSEFFGVQLPPLQIDEEIRDPRNYWTSPRCLQNLVEHYLTQQAHGKPVVALGDKPLKTLALDPAVRRKVLADYRHSARQPSGVGRGWERWLKGREKLTLTFDAGVANENRSATFITPVHPIAQQAARALAPEGPVYLSCRVRDSEHPTGVHRFAIYLWRLRGIREDVMWQPVCSEPSLNEAFLSLIQRAEFRDVSLAEFPPQSEFEALDAEHHRLWSSALAAHRERTRQLASYRRESLNTSHKARLGLLNDQLSGVSDDRIRRMRLSQIQTADDDYARRLAELQQAETAADIIHSTVAFGLLAIVR